MTGAPRCRISTRSEVARRAGDLHSLREELPLLAGRHAETIVTGYTHLQPARPTTLGHDFLAVARALERDETRLQRAYETVNRCPLGACAFTTGFPIDRRSLADLTGFSELAENSVGAPASRDCATQDLIAPATMSVILSRLAQDPYFRGTDEFGWLERGEDVATTSGIMPQKNPITLEHIRSKSSHPTAAAMGALTERGATPADLALLERIARDRFGREPGLTEASLRRSLSIRENVAVRSVTGGPARGEVLRSIAASRTRFAARKAWWARRRIA